MLHGPLKALLFVSRCQRDLWASSTTLAWFQLLLISWELCWIWTHTWMHFPLIYRNSATSWVNAEIFFSQFHKNFMPHVISKLTEMQLEPKALLLLDNCSAHPEADELTSIEGMIKAIFLPANITSLIQSLDQGVLVSIKRIYRKQLLRDLLFNRKRKWSRFYVLCTCATLLIA